jgi:hypothetical protein
MKFEKATRKKAKLRLALTGPSGSGKTYGALQIAKGIGGRVAVIDTEKGSASLYSHMLDFDVLELNPPYTPERFIEAVKSAESAGYDIVIIDSITHEWSGVGGCLELLEEIAAAKYRGNTWSAWNEITPRHRAFLDGLLRTSMHVIATTRSKTETTQTEVNGKKKVVRLGMKAEQRDGVEYEFTTVLDLIHDGHYAVASKDRTGLFGGDPKPITQETGSILLEWLESGEAEIDITPILNGISGSANMDILKTNFEAAIKMLPERHQSAINKATNARKRELMKPTPTPEDQPKQEGSPYAED